MAEQHDNSIAKARNSQSNIVNTGRIARAPDKKGPDEKQSTREIGQTMRSEL
jgi:hypothetical protein